MVQANPGWIAHQRTPVVISHRLSMVRAADLIVVLDQGRIAGAGRHESLLHSCALHAGLWTQQMKRVRPVRLGRRRTARAEIDEAIREPQPE